MKETIKYHVRTIFLFTIITLVLFSYKAFLYKSFDSLALPLLKIDEHDWLLLVFIVLGSIYSLYIVYKAVKGYRLSCFHTVVHVFALILYVYLRYQACTTYIYVFLPDNSTIGYIDIIFLIVGVSLASSTLGHIIDFLKVLVIKFISKKKPIYNSLKLISDNPENNLDKDLLGYNGFAEDIVKQISEIPENETCSLGIVANWGVGKSTAINFIEQYLDKEKKYVTIRFNPRHSYNIGRIQEDFFSFLSSELKRYNSIFSSIFTDYMKSAGIIGKNNTIQIVLNLFNIWNKEGESNRIRQAIITLNKRKRIVVIIEDLDRLLADEIIEVFKIIDNNAISNNIIFISAYDKEHINTILVDKYKAQNSKFTDKFFNWEAHLPLFSYDKIIDFLKAKFSVQFKDTRLYDSKNITTNITKLIIEENKEIIDSLFSKNNDLIESCILSMRDAKRFLNMFNEIVDRKKGHVEIDDLLLITLIQYKYHEEYSELFNYKYIDIDKNIDPNKYILKGDIYLTAKSNELINRLFAKERPKRDYSINNKIEFLDYFYYYPQSINRIELTALLNLNITDSIYKVNNWINERRISRLFNFFNNLDILELSNIQSIYNYIDILLYLQIVHKYDIRDYIRPFFLRVDISEICKKYNIELNEFKSEFTTKLYGELGRYPYSLIRELIINTIDQGESDFFFTKVELQDIAKHHAEDYIKNKQSIEQNLEIELVYENINSLEMPDRIIKLNMDVCVMIKDYIIERPDFYIQSFVRNGMSSSSKEWFMLACEPFWEQIFISKAEFEKFIMNPILDEKDKIKLVRNFWTTYRLNNYSPIQFENQGITYEEAIADDLQLIADEALKFEKYEATIEIIYKDEIATDKKISNLNEILKEMESINLYIRKSRKVAETIKRYIAELSTSQDAQQIGEE